MRGEVYVIVDPLENIYQMNEKFIAGIQFSNHALDMLLERNILEDWVSRAITTSDRSEIGLDNNTHYIKAIPENGGRFLRVIVNERQNPKRVVTVFFDRRLKRRQP